MTITLATRSSPLALWQAQCTHGLLTCANADDEVLFLEVQSSGDIDLSSQLARFGKIGIFTAEVDQAVVKGRADVGVHSMKDLTTVLTEGMVLAGALARGPVEDALVSPSGARLDELPQGARVATGSIRRAAMLLRARPDLDIGPLRGNVATRLSKLDAGEADAIILARAGLERLGLGERITEVLDCERFLPAVGQGIVGLTCRASDTALREKLSAISDPEAWISARAERTLLHDLQGGCSAPIGGHATHHGDELQLSAIVLSVDGRECMERDRRGPAAQPEELGMALARDLLQLGAARLIEAAAS
ncbi:MAG: hydroxymethylbilane synthase [Chlamydiales bacterium]|jgi:hydroxymethylbilane synthase